MKVIDLFCGAGGFSLGFKEAGYEIVLGVDSNPDALATYEANVGPGLLQDVREFEFNGWGRPDVVIGSPPCQSFSQANRKTRSCDLSLVDRFMNLVRNLNPRVWIMEEVEGAFFALRRRGNIGFHVYRVDAADYGVPSRRRRFFASNVAPILPLRTFEHTPASTVIDDGDNLRMYNWDWNKRLAPTNVPAPTLTSKNFRVVSEDGERVGTVQENAALMTFPGNFKWPDKKTVALQQIGNAVPPLLAKMIAETVKIHFVKSG